MSQPPCYHGYRFPPEIISHARSVRKLWRPNLRAKAYCSLRYARPVLEVFRIRFLGRERGLKQSVIALSSPWAENWLFLARFRRFAGSQPRQVITVY